MSILLRRCFSFFNTYVKEARRMSTVHERDTFPLLRTITLFGSVGGLQTLVVFLAQAY